jgi:Mce-associated membrane protein
MESGQDAGPLASSAEEAEGRAAAEGAEDGSPADAGDHAPAGAEGDAPGDGGDDAPAGGEDETSADPGHEAAAPRWAAAMAVLLALLIAGVAVSVVFLARVGGSDAANSRRQAAVAAARNAVTDLTTADYRNPQQYVAKLKADATGNFLSMFTNSSAGFQNLLQQGKVQTTGNVVDVGVQRIGTGTAQLSVLAYVTVKNSQEPSGAQRVYRLSISMISAGPHWLVSKVEFVQ